MDDPESPAVRTSSYEADYPDDYHEVQNYVNESSGFDAVENDPQDVTPLTTNIYYDPDELDANTIMHREESPEPDPPYVPPYVEPVTDLDAPDDEPVMVQGGSYEPLENDEHPELQHGYEELGENGYRNSLPPPPTPLTNPPELEHDEEAYRASYTEPPLESEYRESYGSDQTPELPPKSEYRESYASVEAPEEQLTVLYDSSADADPRKSSEYQPESHTAVMIQSDPRATGIYDEPVIVDSMAVDDTTPIVENELEFAGQRPSSVAEPVVVDLAENNNTGKDITWTTASGSNVQSMAGYSYATNEETIEMVDIVPQERNLGNGKTFIGAQADEDPEFFFKAKSPINMNSYFTCACLGFIVNLVFGAIALSFVQKGRNAETPREAKKKGCIAIVFAVLGLLVTIGILLAVGFTRDPAWML